MMCKAKQAEESKTTGGKRARKRKHVSIVLLHSKNRKKTKITEPWFQIAFHVLRHVHLEF